jgi:hypothetical protein
MRSTVHRYGIPPSVRRRGFAALHAARSVNGGMRLLPDYLLIGGQRCGTTSLHGYITRHPGVGSAFRKEVGFFDVNWTRGAGWYRAHFPTTLAREWAQRRHGHPFVAGEATPYYLFHPAVPERVASLVPQVKLVAVLRDPVERAWSAYQLQRAIGTEPLGFADAVEREEERLAGEEERLMADPTYRSTAHRHFSYQARGRYADQLERWFSHFPREQFLILSSDELFSDPGGTVARVFAFLGLPDRPAGAYPVAQNATRRGGMPDGVRALLTDRFREPNRRLAELLGIDYGWPR